MEQQLEESAERQEELSTAFEAYKWWTGSADRRGFEASYLGHYPNHHAFGRQLFADLGVDRPLSRLPDWLRGYVQLDGRAVVQDFVRAGHFHIHEMVDGSGIYVFDPYAVRQREAVPT